jgi:hypothetical protein
MKKLGFERVLVSDVLRAILLIWFLTALPSSAQSGGDYTLTWSTMDGGGRDVGMIGEEVGRVLPEIVSYEENGVDATGMDYSKLTPLLVEAVKALKMQLDEELAKKDRQIAAQQLQIQAMQTQMEELRTTVDKLRVFK